MRYLICLIFLLSATVAWSGDKIIVNGKEGKVIADKPLLDTAFYKPSDNGVSDTILMGRAIVKAHQARKVESSKTLMSFEDRVATTRTRLANTLRKLKVWGFKDAHDFLKQSEEADIAAGVKESERWQ